MMSALIVAPDEPNAGRAMRVLRGTGQTAGVPTAEELCQIYATTVSRFAAILAASDQDAEDLAQEALFKAVRNLSRFDPNRGNIDGWLWRIIANTAKDSRRAGARRVGLWRRLVASWAEPAASVEERAIDSITNEELLAAIRRLGDRDRILIALRFGADLELSNVGDAVGLSADSAGQAVLRALVRLRRVLEVPG